MSQFTPEIQFAMDVARGILTDELVPGESYTDFLDLFEKAFRVVLDNPLGDINDAKDNEEIRETIDEARDWWDSWS
jgi:hypothetical protein